MSRPNALLRWLTIVAIAQSTLLFLLSMILANRIRAIQRSIFDLLLTSNDEEVLISHEHELRTALVQIREVIDLYTVNPPQSLNDLITAGYINQLPLDPFTGKTDWVPIWYDCSSEPNCKNGIKSVHSASNKKSGDGTFYKDW